MKVRNLILAAALALFASSAFAEGTVLGWGQRLVQTQSATNPQGQAKIGIGGGFYQPDSSARPFLFDSNNNLRTAEQFPPGTAYSFQPSVISGLFADVVDGQTTAGTFENKDSTTVVDCRGFNRAALFMFASASGPSDKGGGDADSLTGAQFALQIRSHSGSIADSQSVFRIVAHTYLNPGTSASARDSIGNFSDLITYNMSTRTAGGINDSTYKTSLPDEKIINVGNINGPNRGMLIWTAKLDESAATAPPFLSWRLRYLLGYGGGLTPVRRAEPLPMRVRCDLLLWRE